MNAGVPVPDDTWTVPVDADGKRITDRPPGADDFLARPPIEFPIPATVSFDNGRSHDAQLAENAAAFERALFFLSQSDLGRRLLERLKQQNIHFVYDPETTRKRGAALINDNPTKTILMDPKTDPMDLAAFIAHESQHVAQNLQGLYYLSGDTVLTATAITLAQEADARAAVVICMYQAIVRQADDNRAAFKMKVPDGFWERILPDNVAIAARAVEPYARQGDWRTVAQIIYDAFQRDDEAVANYTVRTLDAFLGWFPEETQKSHDFFMVNKRLSREDIESMISLDGMRYLCGDNPYRDHYAFSRDARVQERCSLLKQQIKKLSFSNPCRPVIDWEANSGICPAPPPPYTRALIPACSNPLTELFSRVSPEPSLTGLSA